MTTKPLFSLADTPPRVTVFDNKEEVGQAAAQRLVQLIEANNADGSNTVLGLATGSTVVPVYAAFSKMARDERLDLSRVVTFNLDEYVGLSPQHPQSFRQFMFDHLFNGLIASEDYPEGFRPENIHLPSGYAKGEADLAPDELRALRVHYPAHQPGGRLTAQEERWILDRRAEAYEAVLNRLGPIDLQLLGIGVDGHIAFAEPGAPLDGLTGIVVLADTTRRDNSRFFHDDVDAVPESAVTMGVGTILKAKEVLLMATGAHKRDIVKRMLHQPISSALPATALRRHPAVDIYLDRAASDIE